MNEPDSFCESPIIQLTNPSPLDLLTENSITASLSDVEDKDNNMVGSSNGNLIMKFKPGKYFPIYGGILEIQVPNWYGGDVPDSQFSASVSCTSDALLTNSDPDDLDCDNVQKFGKSTSGGSSIMIIPFSNYDQSQTEITIKCKNFRNPLWPQL